MPNGPSRNEPAPRSSRRAEHAGRVEARDAEPVDRSVGGDERARVAVREERVVGDRREGRRRGGALRARLGRLDRACRRLGCRVACARRRALVLRRS